MLQANNESTASWLGKNLASAVVWTSFIGLLHALGEIWLKNERYKMLGPYLIRRISNITEQIRRLDTIFSAERGIKAVCTDAEVAALSTRFNAILNMSEHFQNSLKAFENSTQPGIPAIGSKVPYELGTILAGIRSIPSRLGVAINIGGAHEMHVHLDRIEKDVNLVKSEVCELVLRYRPQLTQSYADDILKETDYRPINDMYNIGDRYIFGMATAVCTQNEIAQYNFTAKGLEVSHEDWTNSTFPAPLRWARLRVQGSSQLKGLALTEFKRDPFPKFVDRRLKWENNAEKIRSAYGLARLADVPKAPLLEVGDINKVEDPCLKYFKILRCLGFIQEDDGGSIYMIWEPPIPVTDPFGKPRLTTLRECVQEKALDNHRCTIAAHLVGSLYVLLEARWYHRDICLNNVIAFDNDWSNPRLVGFGMARFRIDGFSDPSQRDIAAWPDRYYHHPDRYNGSKPSDVHFRMKHDIYGLGILLLEIQKAHFFGSNDRRNKTLATVKDNKTLAAKFVKFAKDRDRCYLGEAFIAPIVSCLSEFESDGNEDWVSEAATLRKFKMLVVDPILQIAQEQENREEVRRTHD